MTSCNQQMETYIDGFNPNDFHTQGQTYQQVPGAYFAPPPIMRTEFDINASRVFSTAGIPDYLNYTNKQSVDVLPTKPSIMRNNVNYTFVGY